MIKENSFLKVSKFEGLIDSFGLGSRKDQEILLFGGLANRSGSNKSLYLNRFDLEKHQWIQNQSLPWVNDYNYFP